MRNVEEFPGYMRNMLRFSETFVNVRRQSFPQRLYVAELLKVEANRQFTKKQFHDAHETYSKSLSIFNYLQPETQNKRKVDLRKAQPEEKYHKVQLRNFLVVILSQIALCCSKLLMNDDAFYACHEAIQYDPTCPKPYVIRSKLWLHKPTQRTHSFSSFAQSSFVFLPVGRLEELENVKRALDDIGLAKKYNPSDGKTKQKFKELQSRFERLQKEKEAQEALLQEKEAEAQMTLESQMAKEGAEDGVSLMDYYNILYDEKEGSSYETNPRAKIPKKIGEVEVFLNSKTKEVIQTCLKNGKNAKAEYLNEKLKKSKVLPVLHSF